MATIIVYWSGTGNTERMANAAAAGIAAAGGEAAVKTVSGTTAKETAAYEKILLGCPAMGAEVLEEGEFQPFYDELEPLIKGKKVGFFGPYDWGDGEWMRNWEAGAKAAGVTVAAAVAVNQDEDIEAAGEALGKQFA